MKYVFHLLPRSHTDEFPSAEPVVCQMNSPGSEADGLVLAFSTFDVSHPTKK